MPITDRRPAESRGRLEVDIIQALAGGRVRGELRDRDAELDETCIRHAQVPPPARLRGCPTRHQAAETERPTE